MLDLVGILFSSFMILFVCYRAVLLDASRPWFEKPPPEPAPASEAAPVQPARRPIPPAPTRSAWGRSARSRGPSR